MQFDDWFFIDPKIDNKLALELNLYFLEQSYKRKSEHIYVLHNSISKEILGFHSFKLPSESEATMLINGFVHGR